MGGSPLEFRWRIKTFLDYYLGTEDKPSVFGGRGALIEELNQWLHDPKMARNLLLWGPAGRGKSALLVQWLLQLDKAERRAFVPISIRADTNTPSVFYEALATRLAKILDKRLEQPSSSPVAFYKERALEYLSAFDDPANPCLLVIDGLDEANGWTINPLLSPNPPKGLKVLVSARLLARDERDKGWLRRLGWNGSAADAQSREVPPLDRNGVRDVLVRMGDPLAGLAEEDVIADELYRLTDCGDPLLLALYIRELVGEAGKGGHLKVEDLRRMRPGLGDLFWSWYDSQKQLWERSGKAVDMALLDTMLAVLASAMGPLLLSDIEEVTKRALTTSDATITPSRLDPLERWCISTASPNRAANNVAAQGLVLSHPRLGQFFRETAFATSGLLPRVCEAFRSWGRDAARGADRYAGSVPSYVLHHHLQHLEQESLSPLESYRELAENRWRLAWKAEEGGYGTFSDQMEVCWRKLDAAHRTDPETMRRPLVGLGGLIHIGLCLSSVRSIGTDVPPTIILEMVAQGLLTPHEALLTARFRSEDAARVAILKGLLEMAPDDKALHARVAAEASLIQNGLIQAELLLAMVRRGAVPVTESLEKLVGLVACHKSATSNEIEQDNRWASDLLADALAIAFRDQSLLRRLVGTIETSVAGSRCPDDEKRKRAKDVQAALLMSTVPEVRVAEEIEIAVPRTPSTTKTADPNFTPAMWIASLSPWDKIDPSAVATLQHRISQDLDNDAASTDMLVAMLDVALSADWFTRHRLVVELARLLTPDQIAHAIDVTLVGNDFFRAKTLSDLVLYLDADGRIALAKRALGSMPNFDAEIVNCIVDQLSTDQLEQFLPMLEQRLDQYEAARVYQHIAPRLEPQHLTGIVAAVVQNRISLSLTHILGIVRGRLSDAQKRQLVDHALKTMPWRRKELLKELGPALGPDILDLLLTRIASKPDRAERLDLLDQVLPLLSGERRGDAVGALKGAALKIGDQSTAALALGTLGLLPTLGDAPAEPWRILMEGKDGMVGAISLAFVALLPHVGRDLAEQALHQARDQAMALQTDDISIVTLLSTLSPHLGRFQGEALVRHLADWAMQEPAYRAPEASLLLFSSFISASDAQAVTRMLLNGMRDVELGNDHEACAAILLLSSHTGMSDAAEALAFVRRDIDKLDAHPAVRSVLLAAVALCGRLSSVELTAIRDAAATITPASSLPVSGNEAVIRIARYCLLGLLPDEEMAPLHHAFVTELAGLSRMDALILIAAAEGGWDRVLGLQPAVSGGKPSISPLRHLGGEIAVAEVASSIRQVTAWWP